MFTSPVTITYNAVPTDLHRVNNDNYASTYYGKDAANNRSFELVFSHRLPSNKNAGEGHNAALHVTTYDPSTGTSQKDSIYVNLQTDSVQDDTSLANAYAAAIAAITTVGVTGLIGRQS
nr:MAG: coat protein [Leviviridae sp.]